MSTTSTTTLELVKYYANLLIKQYADKPKAYNTIISSVTPIVMAQQSVQTISFTPVPTSGTFVLSYDSVETATINWNDSAGTIQTKLQAILALAAITVTGSISTILTINFVGVIGVAQLLIASQNNLLASSAPVVIEILETDLTLPLAVQDVFNLETATGVQLDILGKYAGVTRTVTTPTQVITLSDADFITLIKFAVVQNSSGSSLATIESNLNIFFPGKFILTDYKNMHMSYIFSSSIGSENFFLALVNEDLVPRPMAVGITIIPTPTIDTFFGYGLYENGGINNSAKPYNTYEDFNTDWIYLQYEDVLQ